MKKNGNRLLLAGVILIFMAMCLCGYNIIDGNRAEQASKRIMSELVKQIDENPADPDSYPNEPGMDMPTVTVDGIEYIGYIQIPSLKLALPVQSEFTDKGMENSPCRYTGSIYDHDLIIVGHNYRRHFSPIKTLEPGATVKFVTVYDKAFTFRVSDTEVINMYDIQAMTKKGDWDLTLFTCTYGGRSRFTLRCQEQD